MTLGKTIFAEALGLGNSHVYDAEIRVLGKTLCFRATNSKEWHNVRRPDNAQKCLLKTMFAYKSIECLYQLLKSRYLIVRSISFNPYMVFLKLGNLESWNKKIKKESDILLVSAWIPIPDIYANIVFKYKNTVQRNSKSHQKWTKGLNRKKMENNLIFLYVYSVNIFDGKFLQLLSILDPWYGTPRIWYLGCHLNPCTRDRPINWCNKSKKQYKYQK